MPRLGDILPSFLQKMLELTPEQKAQLDGLQQGFDQKLETLLADDQRQQFQDMRDGLTRGGPFGFGPPGFGPPGPPGLVHRDRQGPVHRDRRGLDHQVGQGLDHQVDQGLDHQVDHPGYFAATATPQITQDLLASP